ncbi:MAG: hypothetical protein WEA36_09460 [Balneolaceae bacterium]
MKTSSTLVTIVSAILLLIATEQATAQIAETSTDVTVSAYVGATLNFTPVNSSLSFGLVDQNIGGNGAGSNPSIDPTDGTRVNILDDTNVSIAKYELSGTDGLTVQFEYSTLALTNGAKTLNFLPEISSADGDADTNDGDFGGATLQGNNQVTFSSTNMTLWVGGTLEEDEPTDDMVAGAYEGNLTITVDYIE